MVQEEGARSDSSRRLLERAKAGDGEALDTLYARYIPRLSRFGRGRLPAWARERLETEDLVQETLVHTLGRIESFERRWEGALQAYLRQALLNRVRDEVRRAGRRRASRRRSGSRTISVGRGGGERGGRSLRVGAGPAR